MFVKLILVFEALGIETHIVVVPELLKPFYSRQDWTNPSSTSVAAFEYLQAPEQRETDISNFDEDLRLYERCWKEPNGVGLLHTQFECF